MDLRAGLQRGFGGSYRIERELGGGGMSRVFLADESALDRKVVIKVLAPELMLGVSAERFKREIALSAKLQHPHIVAVLNTGETTDPAGVWCVPYYTMPFVDGESLRGRMRRTGALPITETLSILRDVARALAFAHEHGVVHRDIKPDNVLITGDSAVVTDFGVAKAIVAARDVGQDTTLTDVGGVIGTPAYMSPEQARGSTSVDHRTDIYGFGVMAYEMLTGCRPFVGDTADQLTESRRSPPKDVSELRPEAPPLLVALVMRCLEHDPHRRPPTAAHVVHVLDNVTSGAGRQPSIDTLLGSRPRFLAALTPRARKGALAAALVLLSTGVIVTRLFGVGPAASRFAAAPLLKNERLLVGDLRASGAARDTTLSTVLTEALRTDLGQSTSFSVMTATALRDALRRMQRDVKTPVDGAVAREIATREGVKAFVDGDILSVGAGFVISVRLVETSTGETLMAVQQRADSEREVLSAIDRVTRQLRERAGDTFKQIHDTPTLEQVTTPSMDALRAYVQGVRALSFDGDWDRGRLLLEEAIALDTAFSMAYRKLAIEMNNRRTDPVRTAGYLAKAFRHRDRLTEVERYLTVGSYYSFGPEPDNDKAIAAYESLAELQPTNATALNNASTQLTWAHRYERAEQYVTRVVKLPDAVAVSFNQLAHIGIVLGDTAQVRHALYELEHRFGRNSLMLTGRFEALYALGEVDTALALALRSNNGDVNLVTRSAMLRFAGGVLAMRGRVAEARTTFARASALRAQAGDLTPLLPALDSAWIDGWLRRDVEGARRTLDRALVAHPVASVHHAVRPYTPLVRMLALVGRTDEAKAIAALFERDERAFRRYDGSRVRHGMAGDIALAEHRYADAAREYFLASEAVGAYASGRLCFVADAAHAYDLAGAPDSAIAVYRRYLETGDGAKAGDMWEGSHVMDATWRAYAYRRLGELYEAKGDTKNAVRFYAAFVDQWKDADPELQPRVAEARRKLAALRSQ